MCTSSAIYLRPTAPLNKNLEHTKLRAMEATTQTATIGNVINSISFEPISKNTTVITTCVMPYGVIMSLEDAIEILTAVPERKSGNSIGIRYLRRPKWFFWLFIDDLGYLRSHHDLQIYRLSTHEIIAKDWSTGDEDTIKAMYNNLRHPYFD